jgi:uncharacterized protein
MNMLIEKNIMVLMRDGVKLATDVYRPVEEGPVPMLLSRTSYNKDLPQTAIDPSRAVQAGYGMIIQDCRGRFCSEGGFTLMFHETMDGVDTLAWIVQQPCCSGPVGTLGAPQCSKREASV